MTMKATSNMRRVLFLFAGIAAFSATESAAQYYMNQTELAEILGPCSAELEKLPTIEYRDQVIYDRRNNSVLARNTFYKIIGDGDVDLGYERAKVVGLLNRKLVSRTQIGDTLVVPSEYVSDFCAYSPFPLLYAGAESFDKLFIIEKSIQGWAAYERGRLARWGIVNTGATGSPTPNGRFNFNWKTEYRISSLSPPGERWEMYWVFNFIDERGIHVHQYAFPTGGPSSLGCVRVVDEDAEWIYRWADAWDTTLGNGVASRQGVIKAPGTTVLVVGEDPSSDPTPFIRPDSRPVLVTVELPTDPYSIPAGTWQQRYFDQQRASGSD
ncbi:MAG: L,D-transpeptidase [Rhodothermia bacterium]|nr:MAG: L,D-transpeptidase [Rhodothermia bacterium]